MAFCRSCGTEATPGRRFCSTCGTPVGVAAAPTPDADPTVLHVAPPAAEAQGAAGWGGPRIALAVVGVVLVLLAAGVGAALVLGRADESASGRAGADRDPAVAAARTSSADASPGGDESSTATPSGSGTPTGTGTPTPTASATPTVAAPRPVTEAVWRPDYVMIRSYRMQADGSAVLTYDRVQPDKEGVVPFGECRYETWDDGTYCVLNNATRQRKAGARPTTVVIGTTGTEVAMSAGVLDALVTPRGTAMQAARLVTLGVDDTGVIDRIGIAG